MAEVLIRLANGSRTRISKEVCDKAVEEAGDGDPVLMLGGVPNPFMIEEDPDVEGGKSYDQLTASEKKKAEAGQEERREAREAAE